MNFVPVRDLRNHTAEVIKRAHDGENVTITVNGTPVVTLRPVDGDKKAFLTREELLAHRPATPDLTLDADIRELSGETTDDLRPLA